MCSTSINLKKNCAFIINSFYLPSVVPLLNNVIKFVA